MSTITMNDVGAIDSTEPRDEVEITLFWGNPEGGSALATKHVAVGRSVRVGEDGARQYFCSVYEKRPATCRELERGSPQCAGEIALKGERPFALPSTG